MTRGSPEPTPQGGGIRSHETCGAPEPSQRLRGLWTHGGARALPTREAGSRAAGHVATSEPTSAGRQDPVLWDKWRRVVARPALCLVSKLYMGIPDLQGTDSGPRTYLGGGSEPIGGANIFFPHTTFLKFHLGYWSGSAPLPADTQRRLIDAPCRSVRRG
jgi:hypothetical protein